MSPVREAKLADRGVFQRLYTAALVEEHAAGSDTVPTGRSVGFGLDYFQSYVSGSRFGVALLWHPEGRPDSPQGFVLAGERWADDEYDRTGGRVAWLFNLYVTPEERHSVAGLALLRSVYRCLSEMGFDTVEFLVPEGCPSGPLARRYGAQPRGVWYTTPLKPPAR